MMRRCAHMGNASGREGVVEKEGLAEQQIAPHLL